MGGRGPAASEQAPAGSDRPVIRPPFGKLLWYSYGGSLPPEYHSWVLHDVTCRTWVLRHFARWMLVIVPVFFLFITLLPTPFGIRLFTDIAVCGAIFMFALVNILVDTDRRAVRAGYSFNLPGQIRGERGVNSQRESNAARRQRIADRKARRR